MLDQILKFIGSFVAFGGITWFISYNLGTIINDGIYHFYFDKRKFTPEELETQKEYERANKWKFRFFRSSHISLCYLFSRNGKRIIKMTIRKAPFFAYLPKTCSKCGRVFIFEP